MRKKGRTLITGFKHSQDQGLSPQNFRIPKPHHPGSCIKNCRLKSSKLPYIQNCIIRVQTYTNSSTMLQKKDKNNIQFRSVEIKMEKCQPGTSPPIPYMPLGNRNNICSVMHYYH